MNRFLQYILTKLLNGLAVMLGVILLIFLLFNIIPVNSARMTLGQRADMASVKAIEHEFRLDLPWHFRLGLYLNDLSPLAIHNNKDRSSRVFLDERDHSIYPLMDIGGNCLALKWPYLGKSFQNRRPVSEIIGDKIAPTAILALFAMLLATFSGILLGIFAALRQYSIWDNLILVFSVLGISQPSYFSAIILAIVFGYYLGPYTGLNVSGSLTDIDYEGNTVYVWKNLLLPVLALGIRPVGIITQLTRNSMLDVLSQDYIRTAHAKGLSYYRVVFGHALRNALNPVITSISGWLAALLTGAFFIEMVFGYKGLGMQTVSSLLSFDFPVVMGNVLFVAFVFVVMNLITDLLYAITDPRVTIR
jgi:peptide/nickel transport system permease protein